MADVKEEMLSEEDMLKAIQVSNHIRHMNLQNEGKVIFTSICSAKIELAD